MTPEDAVFAAAARAGVTLRELTEMEEIHAVVQLLVDVWGRSDNPPVTAELLRAFGKTGNYVAGAYVGDRLVGTCIGFHSDPSARVLHSHIAGVAPGMAGRSVGFALKLHQRAWALQRGVEVIEWTFDPLVARNAYFNLVKLAAVPAEYLTNFYGPMARPDQRRETTPIVSSFGGSWPRPTSSPPAPGPRDRDRCRTEGSRARRRPRGHRDDASQRPGEGERVADVGA